MIILSALEHKCFNVFFKNSLFERIGAENVMFVVFHAERFQQVK